MENNRKEFQKVMSSKKSQEKELSLEEILAECPGAIQGAFTISGKDQEKEVSLEEIFAECPGGVKETTLIQNKNEQQFQEDMSSHESQDPK